MNASNSYDKSQFLCIVFMLIRVVLPCIDEQNVINETCKIVLLIFSWKGSKQECQIWARKGSIQLLKFQPVKKPAESLTWGYETCSLTCTLPNTISQEFLVLPRVTILQCAKRRNFRNFFSFRCSGILNLWVGLKFPKFNQQMVVSVQVTSFFQLIRKWPLAPVVIHDTSQ